MEWLLSKKDQERLLLHRYLLAQSKNAVLIKDVMNALNWSRYMVLQNVESLRVDYREVGDADFCYLELMDSNRAMQVSHIQTISDTALRGFYIRNSLSFDILMDVFLEIAQSNEMIAFKHSSSTTVARVTKVELNEKLAKFNIHISDDYRLLGDETNVRILLFELLYLVYAEEPVPFPVAVRQMSKHVEELVSVSQPVRATVRKAFNIFFGIWYTRLTNGHYLEVNASDNVFKPYAELTQSAKHILSKLREIMSVSFPTNRLEIDAELRFGLGSLYSLGVGVGTYRVANLSIEIAQKFNDIYGDVAAVYEEFFGLKLSDPELELMQRALFSLNLRILCFRQNGINYPSNREVSRRMFPIHTAFTEQVIARVAPHFNMTTKEVDVAVFNEYFNTFVLVLNTSTILPVVTLTIDMIDMPAMEQLLREHVMSWKSVNLNITTTFTAKTDVYISDVQLDDQVPGFAWRAIPEPAEETELHDLLIKMTLKRFKEMTGKLSD